MADYKDNEIILNVQHLQKAYGEHQVLKDISFEVHKGKVMTVIGPSGGGKSTMLRCINLLEDPTGGEILFHDQNILVISVIYLFLTFTITRIFNLIEKHIEGPENYNMMANQVQVGKQEGDK